jgi:hypothetical protein
MAVRLLRRMRSNVKKKVRKHVWGFYVLLGFGIGLKSIYLLGRWTGLGLEFALYTALIFGDLLCLYWKQIKRLPFWITWSSLLLFTQVGIGWPLFRRFWPWGLDPMRVDLLRMKLSWLSVCLALLLYGSIVGLVLWVKPEIGGEASAESSGTNTRELSDTDAAERADAPEVPGLTFQLLRHDTYRCPACNGPLQRNVLRHHKSFSCTSCGATLELDTEKPTWARVLYLIAGLAGTWLIGVRDPGAFIWVSLFLTLTVAYMIAPFVPPKVQIHRAWHGVPAELFSPKKGS